MSDFYGTDRPMAMDNLLDALAESVRLKGYAVVPSLLTPAQADAWCEKVDAVYAQQESAFGAERLSDIKEKDICRAPLLHDLDFLTLAEHPWVLSFAKKMLGDWIILNLQNAVINRPSEVHHQTSWHRDLPYQNFVISRPLSVNALWALDDFSVETGGTCVLPFSHKSEFIPSQAYLSENELTISVPKGSVLLFDSMLFHRAGVNRSGRIRRSINHMYTVPILKQQYDFPRALQAHASTWPSTTLRLLGFDSQVPLNDTQWRENRIVTLKARRGE